MQAALIRRGRGGIVMALILALTALWPTRIVAQDAAQDRAARMALLMDVMGLPEIVVIMREEGLLYGADLGADMLPGGGGASWRGLVSRIYDSARMTESVGEGFVEAFGGADPEPLIAFFQGGTGAQIVALEIAARRAFMDGAVEETAREAFRRTVPYFSDEIPHAIDPHQLAIEAYVEANDLIGFNVMGAMNANYQFYRGLIEGGALEMSEEEVLSDVWAQEEDTRAETREWIYAFLMLAYEPLEPDQINDYVDLSLTPSGRAMNRALFEGFDRMYGDLSRALGLAVAGQMRGEEL